MKKKHQQQPLQQQQKRKQPQKQQVKQRSSGLTPREEEFRWLHWVYSQWKDVKPGSQFLGENVLKQMVAAIPRWARRNDPQAAERAEEILERLIQEALVGNPHMTPNATSTDTEEAEAALPLSVSIFNSAMDAYGKIGRPDGVQRILRRMDHLRKTDVRFRRLLPDAFSMSILATAWAKSQSPDAALKAEGILQYMELNGLSPNTVTYNAILNAVAVGNRADSALRAEDIVRRMKQRHEENGDDCDPDVYSYQSLIQAWSRTLLPGAPQRAEQILRFLDDESEQNKKLTPNSYCFTSK
jgi:hypothetical protein